MEYKVTTEKAMAPLVRRDGKPIGISRGDESARIQLATAYALIGIMERLERLALIEETLSNLKGTLDEIADKA